MTAALERQYLLDLPVDPLPLAEAVARAEAAIRAHQVGTPLVPMQIVTLNAEMAMQARASSALADVIRQCGLVVPDGSGVVWALKRRGTSVTKVAGVELVDALAARAAQTGFRLYLLGAKPGVAAEAGAKLAERHPGLVIAGARDGYFGPDDEPALIAEIRAANVDILLVALGVPRQELWIAQQQAALDVPVAMGVGGSLDVFAGRVRRAPLTFQRLHLEWLYRLVQEPWRFQRMRATLPAFVGEVLKHG
jgi:N-acetylglucosaminyldiphosphoundecaprenol N-acetyl-beta-D-mannosaminyltransferase